MIKKIYFQSIFFSFLFFKEAFAAESGGMPQLNPEFWISQILENIEAAEKQREDSEAKLKEYDEII